MGIWYATREAVKAAAETVTSLDDADIDRAIESASRTADALCHRRFYPWTGTKYFDWPNHQYARSWRLWLDEHELVSLTAATAGDEVITSDVFLEPVNSGPPYDRIEVDLSSSSAFSSGDTMQRSIAVTGVWGYQNDETSVETITEALDSSETAVDVHTSVDIGIGSVIRCENERMVVTGKTMRTTLGAEVTTTALTASTADTLLGVTAGTHFHIGEVVLLDSERLLVTDIAGNNLVVKRAQDGTVLAAHNTGVTLYVPRTLTVERGALGTTAASHADTTALYRWNPPILIAQYTVAQSLATLLQTGAGYASTADAGSGTSASTSASALASLTEQVRTAHARMARTGAV